MSRQYKAFISYRHLPLDLETAKKVHRAIEHFVIPRALRRDGKRKLGYVFRDEDELPVAGELTDNIRQALENSEYLIVICTPETSKSVWVLKEIETFLQLRDRSHVLLVLADGEPAESFPRAITELRDADGRVIGEYEPMAANLNAPTAAARRRKFKTEILRVLAALLGCPFDDLYRRERRWQRRRAGLLLGLAGLVAAVFIGMLLNRNAEIRRQLDESRRNESLALAALSETAYQEGKYNTALRYAIDALPSPGNERPYVPEAEAALRRELTLYDSGFFNYTLSIEQETKIQHMVMSEDGTRLFTADPYGCIRAYDLDTGACLWSWSTGQGEKLSHMASACGSSRLLLDYYGKGCCILSAEDGSMVWEDDTLIGSFSQEDRTVFLARNGDESGLVSVLRAEDGSLLASFSVEEISSDALYRMAISPDERYLALLADEDDDMMLFLLDLEKQEYRVLPEELKDGWTKNYALSFSQENELAVAGVFFHESAEINVYSPKNGWRVPLVITTDIECLPRYYMLAPPLDLLVWNGSSVLLGSQMYLRSYDASTGQQDWALELEGSLCGWTLYDNGSLGLVLDNGLICFTMSGRMFSDRTLYSFSCRYGLEKAVVCGRRYLPSRFVVVPAGDAFRAAMIQAPQHGDWTALAAAGEDFPENPTVVLSPSGEKLAAFARGTDSLDGCVIDLRDGGKVPFSVPLPEGFQEYAESFLLTEDGLLLAGGARFLLREGRTEALREDPGGSVLTKYGYCSAVTADGTVLTVVTDWDLKDNCFCWRDGVFWKAITLPAEMARAKCVAVGSTGWVLLQENRPGQGCRYYSFHPESERWSLLAEEGREKPACCFAAGKPRMAWLRENELELWDLERGQTLYHFPILLPVESVIHMEFCRNDSLLFFFTREGELLVYDAEEGDLLTCAAFGGSDLALTADTAFSLRELPDRKQMLVFVCHSMYTEPFYLLLETESWKTLDAASSPACYDAVNDRLILNVSLTGLWAAPLYSTEELIALGREALGQES